MSKTKIKISEQPLPNKITCVLSPKDTVSNRFFIFSILLLFGSASGCYDTEAMPESSALSAVEIAPASVVDRESPRIAEDDYYVPQEMVTRSDEECCTDPGAIALCWWQDAKNDNIVCLNDTDCTGGGICNKDIKLAGGKNPPNNWGLCGCDSDSDCPSGICTTIEGQSVCGPSFCNGYMVCSCFSGCTKGNTGSYDNPGAMCSDTAKGYPGECCEGIYPSSHNGDGIGFCSDSCKGSGGATPCLEDSDCDMPISAPYSEDCIKYVCDAKFCRLDYYNENNECTKNVEKTDLAFWGDDVRDEVGGNLSCFIGRCNTTGRCLSDPTPAEGLPCDDDDSNTCTTEVCKSGVCDHDPVPNVGLPCNGDDNACSLDYCEIDGTCPEGDAVDCNDSNICTYPDECVDSDPDHIIPVCSNPPVSGNATDYGYVDSIDCEDLICHDGASVPTATDCSSYNPDSLDLQCNAYSCVDGNGEDNCTLSYIPLIGAACNDGDACTIGDLCVEDSSGFGVCGSGPEMDCDDGNECTIDTCSGGVCSNTPDTGAACEDGNPCTLSDKCDATGSCISGATKDCSGFDSACSNGVCNVGTGNCQASHLAAGTSCNADSNLCTIGACNGSGTCVEPDKDCSAENDQCNTGACRPSDGACIKDPSSKEGDLCNADSDGCTPNDYCESGTCKAGTTVTAYDCESEILTAHSDFDLDCNTAECNSTGNNSYVCDPVPLSPAPSAGSCNADNSGCTLDTCSGNDANIGAVCVVGDELDCDASGNPPCLLGVCVEGADYYSSSCGTSDADSTVSCNFDDNGCTVDDKCDGAGACAAGSDAVCTTAEACMLSNCSSTGENSYTCVETVDTDCCVNDADCEGMGFSCTLDNECNTLTCNGGVCECDVAAEGTSCSGILEPADYPENCYETECSAANNCEPSLIEVSEVENNLCSDLFDASTALDTTNLGYLGSLAQTAAEGTVLSSTGSTLCGANNYKALASDNCAEAGTGADLGSSSNDVVYGFEYQAEAASSRVDYAYLVKVEADFDVAVYAKDNVSSATYCPEGNNPGADVPGTCTTVHPVTRLGNWVSSGAPGGSGTTTRTMTFTPSGAGSGNRLLVVAVEVDATTNVSVSSITYGTRAGTSRDTRATGSAGPYLRTTIYTFTEAQMAGRTSDVLSVVLSSSTISGITVHAAMFDNVNQTTPVPSGGVVASTNTSGTNPRSTVVTVPNGGAVVNFAATTSSWNMTTWSSSPASNIAERTDVIGSATTAGSAADAFFGTGGSVTFQGSWSTATGGRVAQVSMVLSPATTTAPCINTPNWQCKTPYTGASAVMEETCATGNAFYSQTCCDSCVDASCGYKWCDRGYRNDGTNCVLCTMGSCNDYWEYPESINCAANKPVDASYSGFTNIATTIIRPSAKDGAWKNAVIVVDGSKGGAGNFYITVEKVRWVSSPCERVDDDMRIWDATSVGGAGRTYYDTLNDLANSHHNRTSTTCGGFNCTPTWSGTNVYHASSTANQFWPAEIFYSIARPAAAGSSTYCVTTSNPASNALDAVLSLYTATGTGSCSTTKTYVTGAHDNYLGTNEKLEFTANAGTKYLVGVSRYESLNRPCFNGSGDNCDTNVNIIEGTCPVTCVALTDWYTGYTPAAASANIQYSTAPTYNTGTIGTIKRYLVTGNTSSAGRANNFDLGVGWDGKDEVHRINYLDAGSATLYFSGCMYGGSGTYNGMMALYDCRGNLLVSNDDGTNCGVGKMAEFSYTLQAANQPYYLVADGRNSTDNGPFNIAIYYAPTCGDTFCNGTETCDTCPTDCGPCTLPSCASLGKCSNNADCVSPQICDLSSAGSDPHGCGVCTFFNQCSVTDTSFEKLYWSGSDSLDNYSIPMSNGCVKLSGPFANDPAFFNNISNPTDNKSYKIHVQGTYTGTCEGCFPYYFYWHTTYCKTFNGTKTINATISFADWTITPFRCSEYGHLYGTQKISALWEEVRIPFRRYTTAVDIMFDNDTPACSSCSIQLHTHFDSSLWGSATTGITCAQANVVAPHFSTYPVACNPDPPH